MIFRWAAEARPTAAAFSPTDLGANLRYWTTDAAVRYQDSARTSLVTAAAQSIGSWTDASGLSNHGTSSSTARPLEPAGRDGATFDGANDTITTPALAAYAGDFFVGLVLTPTSLAAGFVRFLERVSGGGGVYIGTGGSSDAVLAFVAGASSAAIAMSTGAKHYVALERTGTTGKLYVDSATAGATWTVPSSAIADAATVIGGPDGAGPYYDGVIHEVVVAKDTSGGDIANLLAYLATV